MTTQLFIFNESLGHLGERQLASLSENREPRRVLDYYWAPTVSYALLQGLWRFARRTSQIDADNTIGPPQFGFNFLFEYPEDWVRTQIISTSPQLDPPLIQYRDEGGFIYANATPIYLSYISNDPQYGMNIGQWPENFADYIAWRLARLSCMRLTSDKERTEALKKDEDRARRVAKGTDAMNDPPGFMPVPFWARARRGAFGPGGLWFGGGSGSSGG